jgi:hypothetical protein
MLQERDVDVFGLDRFKPNDPQRSYTLPGNLYYDANVYRAEQEAVFRRSWNYVCHESQLAEPGSYTTTRIGDQNIAIVRGRASAADRRRQDADDRLPIPRLDIRA